MFLIFISCPGTSIREVVKKYETEFVCQINRTAQRHGCHEHIVIVY
jgi:hypothetical protein